MKKRAMIIAAVLILIGLIGLAFNKFDLDETKFTPFQHEWEYINTNVEGLTISNTSHNVDVVFEDSPDDNIYIKVVGEVPDEVLEQIKQASLVSGQFTLKISKPQNRWFSLGIEDNGIKMSVALPNEKTLQNIDITSKSGNLFMSNINVHDMNIKSSSGHVKVEDSESTTLNLRLTSGNVKLLQHQGDVVIDSTSGNVLVEQLEGDSIITSTSGYVKTTQYNESNLTITTTSGNVKAEQQKPGNASIEVKSGNVRFKIAKEFGGNIHSNTNSGNISTPKSRTNPITSEHLITIKSTSGNIKVTE